MKQIPIYIYLFLSVFITGCYPCTKKACKPENAEIGEIVLKNYTVQDAPFLVLFRYSKNSNFSDLLDSVYANTVQRNGQLEAFIHITKDYEYKLRIGNTKESHTIGNYEISRVAMQCNGPHCGTDYFYVINSYELDGTRSTSFPLTLAK